jgi:hypothetical protein
MDLIKSTIVSAFVCDINMRDDITFNKYYEFGKLLIQCDVPKIIFLDETMYNKVSTELKDILIINNNLMFNDNTRIYKIQKKSSYLYQFEKSLTNFQIITDNLQKDTIEFMFTMCNKTEWIKEAIILNDFNTTNYIWVDFGIRHVFECDDDIFKKKINNLKYKEYNNIRIASIWWNLDTYSYNKDDIYSKIMWFFAGGVFGGNKEALLLFIQKMKDKCIEIMTTRGTIMWEVNIWYMIYVEFEELFYRYWCDHNNTIIDHY